MKLIKNYTRFILLVIAIFSFTNCSSVDEKANNLSKNISPGFTRIVGEIISVNNSSNVNNDLVKFEAKVKVKNIVKRGSAVSNRVAKGETISLKFEYPKSLGSILKKGDTFEGDITEEKNIALNQNSSGQKFLIYTFNKK